MNTRRERKIISWLLVLSMVIMLAVPATAASQPKISRTSAGLYVGQTLTLKVTGLKSVKWSSSNKKVATVNAKGKVVAKKAGTTVITAASGKKKLKCKVSVKAISLSSKKMTVKTGLGYSLSLSAKDLKKGAVTWKSSNPSVARVSVKNNYRAMVIGRTPGTCTISAKVFGKTYKCKVTVTKTSAHIIVVTPRPTNMPTPKPVIIKPGTIKTPTPRPTSTPTPTPTPRPAIAVNRNVVYMTKSAALDVTSTVPAHNIHFRIEDPNVVAAEWSGTWSGITTQLKLTGLRNGTTRIILTTDYSKDQVAIIVNVSGFAMIATATPRPTATFTPTPIPISTPTGIPQLTITPTSPQTQDTEEQVVFDYELVVNESETVEFTRLYPQGDITYLVLEAQSNKVQLVSVEEGNFTVAKNVSLSGEGQYVNLTYYFNFTYGVPGKYHLWLIQSNGSGYTILRTYTVLVKAR